MIREACTVQVRPLQSRCLAEGAPVVAQQDLDAQVPHEFHLARRVATQAAARHEQKVQSPVQVVAPANIQRRHMRRAAHVIVVDLAIELEPWRQLLTDDGTDDVLVISVPRDVGADLEIETQRTDFPGDLERQE